MVKTGKKFLKLFLKLVNISIGMVGIAMVIYGVWMIKAWQQDVDDSSSHYHSFPWYVRALLGMGIALCAITCLGHLAADTANHFCLSFYIVVVLLMLILETALVAHVFLNSNWLKELKEETSGRFDDFQDFVQSNIKICKWVALVIFMSQGFSVLLATVLRTLGTNRDDNYEREEEPEPRVPLLSHHPSHIL